MVGPLLNPINTTMVSVALAPISRDLGIGASQAIWLVAALYLASAVAQPTMGKLADRFGPKKVFLAGLVVVGVAGVVPEVLTGFGGAVTARVLIGIGTSSAYPAALTTLRQHSARIGKPTPPLVLGALSITSLVSAAAGPPLGGALIARPSGSSSRRCGCPPTGSARRTPTGCRSAPRSTRWACC
nr:MFS transporter [Curtobacterium sp. Csp1]